MGPAFVAAIIRNLRKLKYNALKFFFKFFKVFYFGARKHQRITCRRYSYGIDIFIFPKLTEQNISTKIIFSLLNFQNWVIITEAKDLVLHLVPGATETVNAESSVFLWEVM